MRHTSSSSGSPCAFCDARISRLKKEDVIAQAGGLGKIGYAPAFCPPLGDARDALRAYGDEKLEHVLGMGL